MGKDTIYFDCFAAVGRRAGKDILAPWRTETLLNEMERCSIHGALVFAHAAKETHPDVGNPIVLDLCRQHERLHPCWVGLPHHTGEFPHPNELPAILKSAGVRALKIYSRIYHYNVNQATMGSLLKVLEEERLLLIVDRGQDAQIEWEEIQWICESFPQLPLLLHGVRWDSTRRLSPLAQCFDRLYFEFSSYQGNRMLEYWCEIIGHERLLFGTEALDKSLGAARAYVDYSDLTEEQREAIAGGNLARLLSLELPTPYEKPRKVDAILARVLEGLPIEDMKVIDGHAHMAKKGSAGAERVAMIEGDAEGVVTRNRKLGVNQTCVSAWTAIWTDYRLGNKDTIEGMEDFPDEIVGYAVLDPNYVEDWDAELRYYYEEKGFRGMKPYFPRMRIPYNDPRFGPWWEYGNEHHLFALMHPSDNFIVEMHDLAKRCPNVNFLLAHSGWSWKIARQHVALTKEYPNCFLEITFTAVTNGAIEYMVEEVGSERVIYGSDAPMRDPFPQFGWVVYADITEEDKRNILGRNMQRIFDAVKLP